MGRIYRLHEYPEFPCDFPHTDFAEDLKKLFEVRTDRDQFNIFINNHGLEYLRNLIESHTPILRYYLLNPAQYQRGKERYALTFLRYFSDLDRRKRGRETEQKRLATNGLTETKQ